MLINTSSDHLFMVHLSLENSCALVLQPMLDDFYIQRSTILSAFQRYQKFCYHQALFSSNFEFSDAIPSWMLAELTKSAQILYFSIVIPCKKFRQTAALPIFYGANFTIAS